jgi:hypothetical protein
MNTLRSKRSTILHLRSKDAEHITPGFNTNFSVLLKDAVLCNEDEEIAVTIASAEIPYSFYCISQHLGNNVFHYNDTGTLTIVDSNPSIDELVSDLNVDGSCPFTFTFNSKTSKLTISNPTASNHVINWSQMPEFKKVIGFSNEQDATLNASSSITGDGMCNLATIHAFMVHSNLSQGNVISTRAGNSSTLQKISIDGNPTEIIYLNLNDFRTVVRSYQPVIQEMTIQITDQNNKLIQLNNVNYEMTFIFEVFPRFTNDSRRNIRTAERSIGTAERSIGTTERSIGTRKGIDDTHPIEDHTDLEEDVQDILMSNLLNNLKEDSGL